MAQQKSSTAQQASQETKQQEQEETKAPVTPVDEAAMSHAMTSGAVADAREGAADAKGESFLENLKHEGRTHPDSDPARPQDGLLVTEQDEWMKTGAYVDNPGDDETVIITKNVYRTWYPMGTKSPSYSLVVKAGAVLPKPKQKK